LLKPLDPPDQPLDPADEMQDFGGEAEGWFHALIVSGDTIGSKVDSGEVEAQETENVGCDTRTHLRC
jgi:hypothetical protein